MESVEKIVYSENDSYLCVVAESQLVVGKLLNELTEQQLNYCNALKAYCLSVLAENDVIKYIVYIRSTATCHIESEFKTDTPIKVNELPENDKLYFSNVGSFCNQLINQ
jgi:hypothetical protein